MTETLYPLICRRLIDVLDDDCLYRTSSRSEVQTDSFHCRSQDSWNVVVVLLVSDSIFKIVRPLQPGAVEYRTMQESTQPVGELGHGDVLAAHTSSKPSAANSPGPGERILICWWIQLERLASPGEEKYAALPGGGLKLELEPMYQERKQHLALFNVGWQLGESGIRPG